MLLDKIKSILGENAILEHPKVEVFGDWSCNLARLKLGSDEVIKLLSELRKIEDIEDVEIKNGSFLNIRLRNEYFSNTLDRLLKNGVKSVIPLALDDKRVIIDYSSPNIAKFFGIGHLRSTIIGQAIYNLIKFLGAEVIGDNHLGDWGTQFGKLLFMIDKEKLVDFDLGKLEELYVEYHKHPEWEEEGQKWFKKLESGDNQAKELWNKCVEVSMIEFKRIYDMLGVNIDMALGESFYEDKMGEIVKLGSESQGARIIEIEGSKTPLMILKSDGGTTYATRDLATLKYRVEKWDPEVIIYEVGAEQTEYFKLLFAAAKKYQIVKEKTKLVHTRHGMYLGSDGKKFKTRTGNTVRLKDVLNEAIERARKLGNNDDKTAQAVGIGAIKYFDLMHGVQGDIVFEWEKVMNLEGNSGPYLQYTFARTQSVLAKSQLSMTNDQSISNFQFSNYAFNDLEVSILRWLERFPEVVVEAGQRYAPNMICTYLYELAQRYNSFYNKYSILNMQGDPALREQNSIVRDFRLMLTAAVGEILKTGLGLLGIEALERM